MARRRAPTASIWELAAEARSAVKRGRPAASSSIISLAKVPSRMSDRILRMFSRTCSSITFGPRVRSPYSAVSEIE